MPHVRNPRRGSMQFWPRKRVVRQTPRVRCFNGDGTILAFAGYKAGMTHVMAIDNRKNSLTKGEEIRIPVTILECPPMTIIGARFYKKTGRYGLEAHTDIMTQNLDKTLVKALSKKITLPKKSTRKIEDVEKDDYSDIRALLCTHPSKTNVGKKKTDIFEAGIGGTPEEKIAFLKDNMGKEISVKDVLSEGEQVDIHGVTKGKGTQGPVKRFGIKIRRHKSEKTKRGPGTLGPWRPHHGNYRVPHQGQMGYHLRTQWNSWLVKIGNNPEEINPKGGIMSYGVVRGEYILLKGSVQGPKKRMVILTHAQRANPTLPQEAPTIEHISK